MAAFRVFRRLAELLDVNVSAPTDGQVLTYDTGTSKWRNEAGGVSGSPAGIRAVRFPITFATPGLAPESFPIIAVDVPGLSVTVAGDRTAAFAVGVSFNIVGSSANDQGAAVTAVTLVGGDTVIEGNFFFLDPTVDGDAVVAVGATVYTPTVGDILLGTATAPLTVATVSQAWNGTTPFLRVLTESYRRTQASAFVTLDATVTDETAAGSLDISAPPGFTVGPQWRLWRFTTADPIIVYVDDGNGFDPGATQGAAEIVLLILPAA